MSTPLRERPDAPLGTLIFRAGLLPAETIESALEEGVKTGKRLGEILTERGLLKEVDLARLLAGQKGLEFVPVREHIVDPAAASLFTHDQARLFRALPYAFEDGVPVVAIPDPTDDVVLRNIREALGREEVRFVVSTRGELAEIVEDVYSKALAVPAAAAAEPAPAPPAEEPSFVQSFDPPSPPAPEEPPSHALNGNGSAPDAAEPVAAAPAPASEPAPLEVVAEATPEPAAAAPDVEEQVVPESPAAPEPTSPAELQAAPEPVLEAAPAPAPAEPEVVQAEPVPAPEPIPAPEPLSAPEPVFSPEPVPALEPVHSPEAPGPAAPSPAPVPLPEPVPSTPAPYPPAASAPAAADAPAPAGGMLYEVTIRLANGERVEAGTFPELEAAKEGAKALMAQVAASGQGEWPFVSGRFLKPDTIVSVDIAEHAAGGPAPA